MQPSSCLEQIHGICLTTKERRSLLAFLRRKGTPGDQPTDIQARLSPLVNDESRMLLNALFQRMESFEEGVDVGLKKRLYFYAKPGITQRTSIRINKLIAEALAAGKRVSTIAASPEDSTWNALPVCCVTGLEAGLVKKLCPPWSKRGMTRKGNGSIAEE